jgi:hypothetical protein
MAFLCEVCGASLKTESSLKSHKLKAKKCIKKQQEKGIVIQHQAFQCTYCCKDFTTKYIYNSHISKCLKKKNHDEIDLLKQEHKKEIDLLKQEIIMLKLSHQSEIEKTRQEEHKKCQEICQQQIDKIKTEYDKYKDDLYNKTLEDKNILLAKKEETLVQLANRPTTINSSAHNNTNNTIIMEDLGLTKKKISKIMEEHFTEERLLEGVQGVVNIVFPSLLTSDGKLKYIVKDSSRNIFEFSKDGKMRRDEGGNYLASMVYDGGFKEMSKVYLDMVNVGPIEDYTDATDEKIDRVVDKFKEIKHIKSSPKKFTDCIKKKMIDVKNK